MVLASTACAQTERTLHQGGSLAGLNLPGIGANSFDSKVYIVRLKTPSAAEYHASLVGPVSRSGLGT